MRDASLHTRIPHHASRIPDQKTFTVRYRPGRSFKSVRSSVRAVSVLCRSWYSVVSVATLPSVPWPLSTLASSEVRDCVAWPRWLVRRGKLVGRGSGRLPLPIGREHALTPVT